MPPLYDMGHKNVCCGPLSFEKEKNAYSQNVKNYEKLTLFLIFTAKCDLALRART